MSLLWDARLGGGVKGGVMQCYSRDHGHGHQPIHPPAPLQDLLLPSPVCVCCCRRVVWLHVQCK